MIAFEKKIYSREALIAAVKGGQIARPLVFTNGVFDILHRGHASYLDAAAQLGASLIVAVNSDASVRSLNKGADRPINNENDRCALLAALASTIAVTVFTESTPEEIIVQLKPDLIVKGGDYNMENLPETALVRSWGGDAVAIPITFDRSTTALVAKIRQN